MSEYKETYKAINYDLDDLLLQKYYPNPKSYKHAYTLFKDFLKQNDFDDRQYSGVVSTRPMSLEEIGIILNRLNNKYEWVGPCVKVIDVTEIGEQYSFLDVFKPQNENKIENTKTKGETKLFESTLDNIDCLLNEYNSIDTPDFDYQNGITQSKEL